MNYIKRNIIAILFIVLAVVGLTIFLTKMEAVYEICTVVDKNISHDKYGDVKYNVAFRWENGYISAETVIPNRYYNMSVGDRVRKVAGFTWKKDNKEQNTY